MNDTNLGCEDSLDRDADHGSEPQLYPGVDDQLPLGLDDDVLPHQKRAEGALQPLLPGDHPVRELRDTRGVRARRPPGILMIGGSGGLGDTLSEHFTSTAPPHYPQHKTRQSQRPPPPLQTTRAPSSVDHRLHTTGSTHASSQTQNHKRGLNMTFTSRAIPHVHNDVLTGSQYLCVEFLETGRNGFDSVRNLNSTNTFSKHFFHFTTTHSRN